MRSAHTTTILDESLVRYAGEEAAPVISVNCRWVSSCQVISIIYDVIGDATTRDCQLAL